MLPTGKKRQRAGRIALLIAGSAGVSLCLLPVADHFVMAQDNHGPGTASPAPEPLRATALALPRRLASSHKTSQKIATAASHTVAHSSTPGKDRAPSGKDKTAADKTPPAGKGKASSTKKATAGKTVSVPKAPHPAKKIKSGSGKTQHQRKRTGRMLVPPPPPTTPTFLGGDVSFPIDSMPIQMMSKDDLDFKLHSLEKRLESARLDYKDQKRASTDKQSRAQKFNGLYKEGVVSRKELESSIREAKGASRAEELARLKVEELDRYLTAVRERLKVLDSRLPAHKKKRKK